MHVWDPRVKTEGVVAPAEGPEVNVVDFLNALNRQDGARDFLDAQLVRPAFQKNVRGRAQDANAGPQHEEADGQTEEWVDPVRTGSSNNDGTNNDGDVG